MIKSFTKIATSWWVKYQDNWYKVISMDDTGISSSEQGGGNVFTVEGLDFPIHADDVEELSFAPPTTAQTKFAHKRWSEQDVELLKVIFIKGRQDKVPHKQLYQTIADQLGRSSSEVERKIVRLYKTDSDLQQIKQENWSKQKILSSLKDLYLAGKPINKNALPEKLRYTLLKVTAENNPRKYFDSVDHALAEAVLECGFCRTADGKLDYDYPLDDIDQALRYIRLGHKKRHQWSLEEVEDILTTLNQADYPITLAFLANHYNIYKKAIKVNRKLESFKDVVKKFIDDGSIKSYADLVCRVAPDYHNYYNSSRSRLKLSSEEIRVKKFLDRYKISYLIPRLSDKLPTGLDKYANFVPDFIILDNGEPKAIVEVFGSIGDRDNAGVGNCYQDKTKAKVEFYNQIPDLKFIEVYNNQDRCDLDDDSLFDRFSSFIGMEKTASIKDLEDCIKIQTSDGNWNFDPYMHGMANGMILSHALIEEHTPNFLEAPKQWLAVEDLISKDASKTMDNLQKFGCAIKYNPTSNQKYELITTAGDSTKFDSLHQLPKLTPKNKALKTIIRKMIDMQKNKYRPVRDPVEQRKDYQPGDKPFDYQSNRNLSLPDIRFR